MKLLRGKSGYGWDLQAMVLPLLVVCFSVLSAGVLYAQIKPGPIHAPSLGPPITPGKGHGNQGPGIVIFLLVAVVLIGGGLAIWRHRGVQAAKKAQGPKAAEAPSSKRAADLQPQPDSSPSTLSGPGWRPPEEADQQPGATAGSRGTTGKAMVGIVGEARGFQERAEQSHQSGRVTITTKVWTFRVERYDATGNRLPPVPVEMRGNSFSGFINDGDKIKLLDEWKEGQLLRTKRVYNESDRVMVTADPEKAGCLGVIVLLVSLSLFTFTILLILSVMRK